MDARPYPLRFRRRLLEKVWGARRLGALLGETLAPGAKVGESWELSDHPSGESVVANGALAGTSLRTLMERDARAIVGDAALATGGRFPLLLKIVDADDRLSVQVHPDDAGAARLGERDGGKNEAWYVLHADPGATLWVGVQRGTTADALRGARTAAQFERLLVPLQPKTGDVIPIPAGTIHAIGPGLTLCEVQQTSDLTYRVYDWGRPASPSRPLHLTQSIEVARLGAEPPKPSRPRLASAADGAARAEMPSPGSFRWWIVEATRAFAEHAEKRCRVVMGLEGAATLAANGERVDLGVGAAALLPAATGACEIAPRGRFRAIVAEPFSEGERP